VPDDLAPLARPDVPAPSSGGASLEPLGSQELDENGWLFGSAEHPIKGQPLDDDLGGVLLKEPGAQLAISLRRVPGLEKSWTATLPRSRMNEFALQLVHAAGVVVARRASELVAFDVKDGTPLWTKTFDRVVPEIGASGGVVLVTLSTASRDGNEPAPASLVGIEPHTGAELFTTALAGTDTRAGQLLAQGDLCVVSSYARTGQAAEVLDVVSGARRLEPKIYSPGATLPLLLPEAGLLALPDAKSAGNTTAARMGGVARLVAWHLDDGARSFDYDLIPLQYKLRWIFPVAEGIAIYGGTPPNARVVLIDPSTGQPAGEPQPLPNEISEGARPIRVVGEEARARVLGFADWRRGGDSFNFSLVAGNGRPLWRQAYELPKNTVLWLPPDRLFRKGGALLFPIWMQYGGKCCTDILVVDEASGRLLDRKNFEGGRPGERDDLVRSGDSIVLRQDTKLHVLAWR
jgi:outer membrane protein assembly factor BamB